MHRWRTVWKENYTIGTQKVFFTPRQSIPLWLVLLLPRFDSLDLLPVAPFSEMAGVKPEWNCVNEYRFHGIGPILLFGKKQQTEVALFEVYKPTLENKNKYYFYRDFSTHLRTNTYYLFYYIVFLFIFTDPNYNLIEPNTHHLFCSTPYIK